MKKKSPSKKIATLGILSAQALVLSVLESFIPALPYLPPGTKPGLSNIVTMFAAAEIGLPSALTIAFIKSLFALITRGFTAFCMSLAGGVLSTLVMWTLFRIKKRPFGLAGIGMLSAIGHNLGQVLMASVLTSTVSIISTLPFLAIFSIITGFLTGTILKMLLPVLNKIKNI